MEALIPVVIAIVVALLIAGVLSEIVKRVPFIDAGIKELVRFGIFAIAAIYILLEVVKLIQTFV